MAAITNTNRASNRVCRNLVNCVQHFYSTVRGTKLAFEWKDFFLYQILVEYVLCMPIGISLGYVELQMSIKSHV